MAIKNFQHTNQMVERYTRLSRAYVRLSERFHQLDVEHMKLKGQMVPLLKTAREYKSRLQALETEHANLQTALHHQAEQHQQELQTLTRTYEDKLQALSQHLEELKPLENLLSQEVYQQLSEAEEQIELDEATFQEMDQDASPDLSPEDKALITAYQHNPDDFLPASSELNGHSSQTQEAEGSQMGAYAFDDRSLVE